MIGPALLALAASAAAPTTYVVAGAPLVRFEIEAPLDTIDGASRAVRGTATLDPERWAEGKAKIEVDLASFTTGIALRDEDLRDQFFETSRFKTATMTVSRFEGASAPRLLPGTKAEAVAVTLLELRGMKQVVRVPVQVTAGEDEGVPTLAVAGRFDVELADFGMKRPQRLFLKLGPKVQVRFEALFYGFFVQSPEEAVARAEEKRAKVEPLLVPVARRPERARAKAPRPRFSPSSPEGRGERLVADPGIGGEGNGVTCLSCHALHDERFGLKGPDGTIAPAHSLFQAARREKLWQGIARDAGHAASICARMFMLRKDRLPAGIERDLRAFLEALAPDPAPAFDYGALFATKRSALVDAAGGDRGRGAQLARLHCGRCHVEGGVRPPLTPGLYEGDDLVRRVRWLEGHDAVQMPPLYTTRLPDSELRDILAWLTGDPKERIFQRRRGAAPASTQGR